MRLQFSESALWGWGCSAAALVAAWQSVLGSAARPAWWEQPGGQTHTRAHTHRRIKHVKLKSKVCFSRSHVSPVLSQLHNKGNKRWLQKAFLSAPAIVSSPGLFSTLWQPHRRCYARWLAGWLFFCVVEKSTHLLLVLWWNLALAWTEASSWRGNRRHPRTLGDKTSRPFKVTPPNLSLFFCSLQKLTYLEAGKFQVLKKRQSFLKLILRWSWLS